MIRPWGWQPQNFELTVFMPVYLQFSQSVNLLADGTDSFWQKLRVRNKRPTGNGWTGIFIIADAGHCTESIGYDNGAKTAKKSVQGEYIPEDACAELGFMSRGTVCSGHSS